MANHIRHFAHSAFFDCVGPKVGFTGCDFVDCFDISKGLAEVLLCFCPAEVKSWLFGSLGVGAVEHTSGRGMFLKCPDQFVVVNRDKGIL